MGRITWQMVLGLVVLLGTACGRQAPPLAVVPPPAVEPQPEWPPNTAPIITEPVGQLRSAEQWGQVLEKPKDAKKRSQAAEALGKLGEAGYPYLLRGMRNGSDDIRLASLANMRSTELLAHGRETMPILLAMLDSPAPDLRYVAAGRLSWYGLDSRHALEPLRRLAKNDEDDNVRRMAASMVREIEDRLKDAAKLPKKG